MTMIERNGTNLTLAVDGRMDMNTSAAVHKELLEVLEDAVELTLDCSALDYISSAGIRVLLSMQKEMVRRGGEMRVVKVNGDVYDILEISGFTEIATVSR